MMHIIHLSMSTSPFSYGAGSEISGDLILFDAEYSLEPGEFEYIWAFDVDVIKFHTVR